MDFLGSYRLATSAALSLFVSYLFVRDCNRRNSTDVPRRPLFKLYYRLPTWTRQLCLLAIAGLSLTNLISIFKLASLNEKIADSIELALVIFSIPLDSVHILHLGDPDRFLWFFVYSILWFFAAIRYVFEISRIHSIIFYLFTLVLGTNIQAMVYPLYETYSQLPTTEYICGLFSFITFSFINKELIQPGVKKETLEFEDVPLLPEFDQAKFNTEHFRKIQTTKKTTFITTIWYLVFNEWFMQAFFHACSSTSGLIAPLALEKILIYVKYQGDLTKYEQEGLLKIPIQLVVFLLFFGPAIKCMCDGQSYNRGRHIGIRVKSTLIALIYQKALQIDLSASKESIGKLNNLVSVDVTEIQNFSAYSMYIWCTPYEILLSTTLLFAVIGKAAIAGMLFMVLSLLFGWVFGNR
jgi:hypothetical protein